MPFFLLKNLVPNPSFETDEIWSGNYYDSSQHLFGNRSFKFPPSDAPYCLMPKPIAKHKYYGRTYAKSTGFVSALDSRFEWWGGDVPNGTIIFTRYTGNFPDWTMLSAILEFEEVAESQQFYIRHFVVGSSVDCWSDGLMIIDLTETFGEGNEPDLVWCDKNIPFFAETQYILYGTLGLITDRTEADLVVDEIRGSYDWRALNRVTLTVQYLQVKFSSLGYITGYSPVLISHLDGTISTIWMENDEDIRADQIEAYRANIAALRDVLTLVESTPQTPADLEFLTWAEANDIEQILVNIDETLHRMATTFVACGPATCGGDYL